MTFEIKHATQVDPVEHPNDPSVPIGTDAWNLALLAKMASARMLGRVSAETGDVEELTAEQVATFLELADIALSGSYNDLDDLPTLGTAAGKDAGAAAGNVPLLDGDGKLATSVLPALALTDIFEVASQTAMLALTAQPGDIAIRTDLNKTFALATGSPATLANWKELRTPTDVVLSVAGLTGTITASALKTALAITVSSITDMSANGRSLVAMTYANMFAAIKQAATTTATGVVQLADVASWLARTSGRALTADGLAASKAAVPLPYSATRSLTWKDGWFRSTTLTGNMAMSNPTGAEEGDTIFLFFIGDSATERSITWGTNYKGNLPDVTVTSTRALLVSLTGMPNGWVATGHMVLE